MDFLSKDEKILEKEFLDQGYIIREVANKDALKKIQKFAIDMLSRKGGDSLDNTHTSISINELIAQLRICFSSWLYETPHLIVCMPFLITFVSSTY